MRVATGTQWIWPNKRLITITDMFTESDHSGFFRTYINAVFEDETEYGYGKEVLNRFSMARFAVMLADGDVTEHIPEFTLLPGGIVSVPIDLASWISDEDRDADNDAYYQEQQEQREDLARARM